MEFIPASSCNWNDVSALQIDATCFFFLFVAICFLTLILVALLLSVTFVWFWGTSKLEAYSFFVQSRQDDTMTDLEEAPVDGDVSSDSDSHGNVYSHAGLHPTAVPEGIIESLEMEISGSERHQSDTNRMIAKLDQENSDLSLAKLHTTENLRQHWSSLPSDDMDGKNAHQHVSSMEKYHSDRQLRDLQHIQEQESWEELPSAAGLVQEHVREEEKAVAENDDALEDGDETLQERGNSMSESE